jgi:hypothetical protein
MSYLWLAVLVCWCRVLMHPRPLFLGEPQMMCGFELPPLSLKRGRQPMVGWASTPGLWRYPMPLSLPETTVHRPPPPPPLSPCACPIVQDYATGKCTSDLLLNTEECVVIADKFPKARHHLLLIPKDAEFRHATPSTLTQAHLPKLRKLHKAALAFGTHSPPHSTRGTVRVTACRCHHSCSLYSLLSLCGSQLGSTAQQCRVSALQTSELGTTHCPP